MKSTKPLIRLRRALTRTTAIVPAAVMALGLLPLASARADTVTRDTEGTTMWTCPPGVTSIQVECWGGGGAGGSAKKTPASSAVSAGGGGGAGGAYARIDSVPVTPGNDYALTVPAAAVGADPETAINGDRVNGADVTFTGDSSVVVSAAGGEGGQTVVITTLVNTSGLGGTGSTSGCVGDVVWAGGNGAKAASAGQSGAGGGGAGNTEDGGDAVDKTAGLGGIDGGGTGGTGKSGNGNGNPVPGDGAGGGGGGARAQNTKGIGSYTGATGGLGRVTITFTIPAFDDKLVVTSVPGTATAGVGFSVTVQARDSGGMPINVTQDTDIVLAADGAGTLSGNTATILSGTDSVTLPNVQYTVAETITLSGASISGDGLGNGGASAAFTVDPGAAAQLVFATQPSESSAPSVPFATQPVVEIQDAFGNPVTTGGDATANVVLTLSSGSGTLGGTTSMDALAGVADFFGMGLNIDVPGTDKVLTATAAFGAGTSDPFTITELELTWLASPATHKWTTDPDVNWSGGTGVYLDPQLAKVTFDETGSDASPIDLVGSLNPVSVTVSADTRNYTFSTTGSGKISGTTGLTKEGAGTLTLATANDYSGTTILKAGTININNAEALGAGAFDIGTGVTIDNTSGGPIVNANNNAILLRNLFTFTGTSDLDLGTGTVSMLYGNRTVSVTANTLTMGGLINESGGARIFTKTGPGTLILSGANTYTGGTVVDDGTLRTDSPWAFASYGALTVTGTGTFDLNGNDAAFTTINPGTNTGTITNSGAPAVLTASAQANTALSSLLTGDLALHIANANASNPAITLDNANTFGGGLTLLNGTGSGTRLRVNAALTGTPFGTGPITLGLADTDKAGIMIDTVANTITNDLVFNTALGTDFPGIRVQIPGVVLGGQITANLADAAFSTGDTNSGAATVTGKITGAFGLALTPRGSATTSALTLTLDNAAADNDYAGDTTISKVADSAYTLALGAADQIPNGAGTGNVINNDTLDLNTFSETINGLSGSGIVDTIAGGSPVLTVGDNDQTSTFDGVIRNTAGTLALTKIGAGTLTLNGENTYTGDTTVNGGVLAINGSSLDDSGNLVIDGGMVDLTGEEAVATLSFGAGSVPPGIYSAPGGGGDFTDPSLTGTGLLYVGVPIATGFGDWISGAFASGSVPEAMRGPDDDPDGDQISNLMEYAIAGLDPTVADAPPGSLTGTTLSFDKRQPLAADITYLIEESTDLGATDDWTEVSGGSYVNDDATISYTLPVGPDPENFMRLKVAQP